MLLCILFVHGITGNFVAVLASIGILGVIVLAILQLVGSPEVPPREDDGLDWIVTKETKYDESF